LKIRKLILGFFNVNCYIVSYNNFCFIIDPGADFEYIDSSIKEEKLTPGFILNTHGHYDHIGAVPEIIDNYKIPFYIHSKDEFIITDPDKNLSTIFGKNELSLTAYKFIDSQENSFFRKITGEELEIFNMPGHTPGSVVIKMGNYLFTGDLIFREGVGRTDLPGGNADELIKSLNIIKKFDPELSVCPGHGATTKLKFEIENNYYLSSEFLEGGKNWF